MIGTYRRAAKMAAVRIACFQQAPRPGFQWLENRFYPLETWRLLLFLPLLGAAFVAGGFLLFFGKFLAAAFVANFDAVGQDNGFALDFYLPDQGLLLDHLPGIGVDALRTEDRSVEKGETWPFTAGGKRVVEKKKEPAKEPLSEHDEKILRRRKRKAMKRQQ